MPCHNKSFTILKPVTDLSLTDALHDTSSALLKIGRLEGFGKNGKTSAHLIGQHVNASQESDMATMKVCKAGTILLMNLVSECF